MFKQRTLTAFALLPLVGLMVWLGGWYFKVFIMVVLGISGYEWVRLFQKAGYHPSWVLTNVGIVLFLGVSILFSEQVKSAYWVLLVLFSLFLAIFQYEKEVKTAPIDFLIHLGGVLYIGGLGLYFFLVRELVNGGLWFSFFVALTALGDTGAYLVGQRWGGHKMGQHVSPNKSWEGYAAGIVTAVLTGALFSLIAGEWFVLTPLWSMGIAAVLYAIIPIGDFGISMFKRWAGVKNTSNILPGHGGILDRIDTHLWTMALGYHILKLLIFVG